MIKKTAFIVDGVSHPMKDNLLIEFKKQFEGWDVDVINILEIIKKKKLLIVINLFFILKEYSIHYLLGSKSLKYYFMRTTYIFNQVKKILNEITLKKGYPFTFQMCFLFDGSTPGVLHFVYTDIVHLEYYNFPFTNKWHQNSNKWISLEKNIYTNSERIFIWSRNIGKTLEEKYGIAKEKIELVFTGSNVNHLKDENDYTDKYSSKNILFVGIDWERKGGPQLVEAFRKVLKVHPDARLTIVGPTPEIDIPNCNITGKIPPKEVTAYYNSAAVFCLPTLCEPFGIAFVEAMRFKLPVVAVNLGAVPELVIDDFNGYKVEPYNIDQLANKLMMLIANPDKCKLMGENGHNFCVGKYEWTSVSKKIKKTIMIELEKLNVITE